MHSPASVEQLVTQNVRYIMLFRVSASEYWHFYNRFFGLILET